MGFFTESRKMAPAEYSNLAEKINTGAVPAEYFRANLFLASTRSYQKHFFWQTIYKDEEKEISVQKFLNQLHRDVISILFTEDYERTSPRDDGSYLIKTNLTDIAKKMGYKHPKSSTHLVEKLLMDMQETLIRLSFNKDKEEIKCQMLGFSYWDKSSQKYIIEIPALTAQFQAFTIGVCLPKEINRELVKLPNHYSRIKAMIGLILSSKALKNGISFRQMCVRLDIRTPSSRSKFKAQIKENLDLLKKFDISFDSEREIIYYQQLDSISFLHPVKIASIKHALSDSSNLDKCIGKKVTSKDDGTVFTIKDIAVHDDQSYLMYLEDGGNIIETLLNKSDIPVLMENIKKTSKLNELAPGVAG